MTKASPKPAGLSAGEYATLVVLLAGAIIAAAMIVTWAQERRGILAPGTTLFRSPDHPSMQGREDVDPYDN